MNILVVSHERSGTHFLMNSIMDNSSGFYSKSLFPRATIDRKSDKEFVFDSLMNMLNGNDRLIVKTHHNFEFFEDRCDDIKDTGTKIIYIIRHPLDVFESCLRYFNANHVDGLFPHCDSIEELMCCDPTPYNFYPAYSISKNNTMYLRWLSHVRGWKDKCFRVSYEDLYDNFDKTIDSVLGVIGESRSIKIRPSTNDVRVVFGSSGGTMKWVGKIDEDSVRELIGDDIAKFGYFI